jgi:hypothetical protein
MKKSTTHCGVSRAVFENLGLRVTLTRFFVKKANFNGVRSRKRNPYE